MLKLYLFWELQKAHFHWEMADVASDNVRKDKMRILKWQMIEWQLWFWVPITSSLWGNGRLDGVDYRIWTYDFIVGWCNLTWAWDKLCVMCCHGDEYRVHVSIPVLVLTWSQLSVVFIMNFNVTEIKKIRFSCIMNPDSMLHWSNIGIMT